MVWWDMELLYMKLLEDEERALGWASEDLKSNLG